MCKKIEVVVGKNAEEFQKAFNFKMLELEDKDPVYEFNHTVGYCAYIIYSDNSRFQGTDEVQPCNELICDTCLRCGGAPNSRVKWRKCYLKGNVHPKEPVCDDYVPRRS